MNGRGLATNGYFYMWVSLFWTLGNIFMCGCHFFGHSALFLCAGVIFSDTRQYFHVRVSLFWTLGIIFMCECHFFGHSRILAHAPNLKSFK